MWIPLVSIKRVGDWSRVNRCGGQFGGQCKRYDKHGREHSHRESPGLVGYNTSGDLSLSVLPLFLSLVSLFVLQGRRRLKGTVGEPPKDAAKDGGWKTTG